MYITRKQFLSMLLIITVGFMLAFGNLTKAMPEETWVKVSPAVITVDPGVTFTVDIIVVDAIDLFGHSLKLEWNATLLNYVNVTEGAFIKENTESPEGTQFVSTLDEDDVGTDHLNIGCTTLGDYYGVSGSGVLATVEFEAEGSGDTPLHLFDAKLRNHALFPIEPNTGAPNYFFTNLEDGRFVNVGVPVASFEFSPSSPRVNQTIEFDASASYDTTEDGYIAKYFWDFGDQTNATETDPYTTHEYEVGGNFQISLTVYDDINLTDTETVWLRIRYDHDVAVLDVSLSTDEVTVGETVSVDVIVSNEGLEVESFTVTVYHDDTAVGSPQDVLNLAAGENETKSFTWDTEGIEAGDHRIKAVVSAVEGEVFTARVNNEKLGGTVTVSVPSPGLPMEIIIVIVVVVIVVVVAGALLLMRRRGS